MYSRYYEQHDGRRNDLLSNPEVTFQTFAFDRANIRALGQIPLDRSTARILDVGCGSGAGLIQFLRLGFHQHLMSGVDISEERIGEAKRSLPNADIRLGDAANMPYDAETFDLVAESTMFVLLPSEQIAHDIAFEMVRVTRRGGHLMLIDWRYSKPGSSVYSAMTRKRIAELFGVGTATTIIARERGALVPPLGRRLSRFAPGLYFAVQALFPFAVGQITTILRKN